MFWILLRHSALHEYSRGKRQIFVTTQIQKCVSPLTTMKIFADLTVCPSFCGRWAEFFGHQIFLQQQTKTLSTKMFIHGKRCGLSSHFWKRTSFLLPERIAGSDLFNAFCKKYQRTRFFFWEALPVLHENVRESLQEPLPDTMLVPLRQKMRNGFGAINASRCDRSFVAFGAPAQRKMDCQKSQFLPHVRLAMGVGGSFDFTAGKQIRAHKNFFQSLRLEWLWRLLREPKTGRRIWNAI